MTDKRCVYCRITVTGLSDSQRNICPDCYQDFCVPNKHDHNCHAWGCTTN
jgi:hypothetical protein